MRVFLDEMSIWISVLKLDGPPQWGLAPSNLLKVWIKPNAEERGVYPLFSRLSLELGHLSPCIYWLMFWCQLANLERNWSYLCQTVKGAVITRRNGIFGSASAPLYYPSGKFQNFFQYLGSKEIFQLHLAKVILSPFFFILIALLGYHLHAIKVLHFKCTNSIIFY